MIKIYESKFDTIFFDKNKSFIKVVRTEATKEMNEAEYKNEMQKVKESVIENNAEYILLDNRLLYFIIVPELQEWINLEVIAPAFTHSLKKAAFIEGKDIFANLSSMQAMEENDKSEKPFKYFDNENKALEWLFK